MKKSLLALALVVGGAHAAGTDTTWQYHPYSNEVTDIKVFRGTPAITWIATKHGVLRIKGTDTLWLHPSKNNQMRSEVLTEGTNDAGYQGHSALDSLGNYWIAYSKSLMRFSPDGVVTTVDSSNTYKFTDLVGITASATTLWLANSDGTLLNTKSLSGVLNFESVVSPYTGRVIPATGTAYTISVSSIAAGVNDTVWFGMRNDKTSNFGYYDPISNRWNRSITVAKNISQLWVLGTDKYFTTVTGSSYGHYGSDSLFRVAKNGKLYPVMITTGGISLPVDVLRDYPVVIKGGNLWKITNDTTGVINTGIATNGLTSIAAVAKNSYLLGKYWGEGATIDGSLDYNGLVLADSTKLLGTTFGYGPRLMGTSVVGQAAGPNGALWIATDSAVYYRDNASATTTAFPMFTLVYKPAVKSARILTIGMDSSKVLWIGQSNGLVKLVGTSYTNGTISDSVVGLAFSKSYNWVYLHGAQGAKLYYSLTSASNSWTPIKFNGGAGNDSLNADSSAITKLRASDDGSLWVGANSAIYTWTTMNWKKSKQLGDFDLARNNLWITDGDSMWLRPTNDPTALARWALHSNYVYAESDNIGWSFTPKTINYGHESYGVLDQFDNVGKLNHFDAGFSGLHQGEAATATPILSDLEGGFWIVMTDGVSHLKLTPHVTVGIASQSSSSARQFASIRSGKLALSLPQAASVRVQVTGLDGRTLEDRELGNLTAGEHVVSLGKANGLRLVRVQVGGHVQTLRLTSL